MAQSRPNISATIITKDEELNIAACLHSLTWVDEIVVLDCGSKDRTVDIAKGYTDKVFIEAWRGQGHQKNRAVELAKGPWILSVDADERISEELADEILECIANPGHHAYAMRRKNYYKDHWVRHCGWWPDWVIRLFKKGEAQFNANVIHESLQVPTSVGKLKAPIAHHSFRSPEDFLNRAYWYAYHQARDMHAQGKKASAFTAVSHAGFNLFHTYFVRLGFLDGVAGLLISVSNFVGVFYRYMMLRDLYISQSDAD